MTDPDPVRGGAGRDASANHQSRRMSVDDTLLMAYVDGELDVEQRAQVEAAVSESADLAERLAAMQASVLPYRAAFERQVLPPVPPHLYERIQQLGHAGGGSGPVHRSFNRLALAASFAAGAVMCALLFTLWPTHTPTLSRNAFVSPWIQAAADYQVLYSRETLANVNEDRALTAKIVGNLRERDGMSVSVPDLNSAGLTFKRVQRLSFHRQPVVQMVYLPLLRGDPVALCVASEAGPDLAPQARRIGEMNAVAWRHDHLGYVLLAQNAPSELMALARRVAAGATPSLYGKAG